MKIAIIGAAGVRTPLIVQAILKRRDRLGLSELSLMDIDGERLELISVLCTGTEKPAGNLLHITETTDARQALRGADFVITTFRVGGIESRVIDERVPLSYGILGQETTGAGGFSMGLRSIPVMLDYVSLMQEVCPQAWLINFANPAGMLTEAVLRNTSWRRIVGICDAPASMHLVIAAVLKADPGDIYLDYCGLNHLGWIKRITHHKDDRLPEILQLIKRMGSVPGLPFDSKLIYGLGMIPNEYLYYFYYEKQAIDHIRAARESRGEQVARQNLALFAELKAKFMAGDWTGMHSSYRHYLEERGRTYMATETGKLHDLSSLDAEVLSSLQDEGYAGVALNLMEALHGHQPRMQVLNVPNQGSIDGFDPLDVVEIPTLVSKDLIEPQQVGKIPPHCMGLMKQVKEYEHLTIEAAVEGSYAKARLALTTHPLVRDYALAGSILDEYIAKHVGYFPVLQ